MVVRRGDVRNNYSGTGPAPGKLYMYGYEALCDMKFSVHIFKVENKWKTSWNLDTYGSGKL